MFIRLGKIKERRHSDDILDAGIYILTESLTAVGLYQGTGESRAFSVAKMGENLWATSIVKYFP